MPELTIPANESSVPTPSSVPAPSVVSVEQVQSEDVRRFARMHGLTDYLPAAVRIIEETFPPGSVVQYYIQYSPEDGSPGLVLDVLTPCSAKEASERFEKLLDRWTVEVPIHVRSHTAVTICPV